MRKAAGGHHQLRQSTDIDRNTALNCNRYPLRYQPYALSPATTWALAINRDPFCCCLRLKVFRQSPAARKSRMEKTPAGGDLAGVLYARITARALGSGGLESARHLLSLSPTLFCGCIKQLTLNGWWISGITLPSGRSRQAGSKRERERSARTRKLTRYGDCSKDRRDARGIESC